MLKLKLIDIQDNTIVHPVLFLTPKKLKNLSFFLLSTLLLLMPAVLLAQAPPMGQCASFALFTPVGALANTGFLTAIVGDIGTNSGAVSGYIPGSVVGQTHMGDSVTAQAAIDVQTAYNYLVALPCPAQPGPAPAMGSGLVLAPGTYCQGGAASVVGDLILDGQNQANPLFIFKINGALSTSAASRVLLINGATPNNVYWQVNGAVSFAATTAFVGTIIGHGALDFGDGAALNGVGLSTVGAISTYNNRINWTPGSSLPVVLVAFTARAQGSGAVALAWRTASEKNSARFEVERSTNGTAFARIGTVPAAGNSSAPRSYAWTDRTVPAQASLLYYRLRQVDTDSVFTYSPVRAISQPLSAANQLVVYPNPAHGVVRVQVLGPTPTGPLQLLDVCGRTVQVPLTLGADGVLPLHGLPAGIYVLRCGSLAQRLTLE